MKYLVQSHLWVLGERVARLATLSALLTAAPVLVYSQTAAQKSIHAPVQKSERPNAAPKVATPAEFPSYHAPRNADGNPDFEGIWQAFVTADIDIQDHGAQAGPRPDILGAYGAWPGGQGIVEGGEIPYKPEALAKKKENAEKRMVVTITSDPH